MKTKLFAVMLLAGSSLFAGVRFSVGIGVGVPVAPVVAYAPPPAPVVAYAPPASGVGFVWVPGYQYFVGGRYVWRPGYWARPPFAGAHWVAPRYYSHRYYPGYWRR